MSGLKRLPLNQPCHVSGELQPSECFGTFEKHRRQLSTPSLVALGRGYEIRISFPRHNVANIANFCFVQSSVVEARARCCCESNSN